MSDHPENGKTKIDVAKLEVRVDSVIDDVEKIKENHLPHIYDKLNSIEKKIAYWCGGVAVGGIVVQAVISSLK